MWQRRSGVSSRSKWTRPCAAPWDRSDCRRRKRMPSQLETGLGRNGLEALFPKLAEHIDHTPPGTRERFLVKAVLLLAEAHGNLDVALRCLDDAATSTRGSGP